MYHVVMTHSEALRVIRAIIDMVDAGEQKDSGKKKVVWTDAMREAAAKRMRAVNKRKRLAKKSS